MDGFVWSVHLAIVGGRCKHNGPITVVLNLYLCKKHRRLLFYSLANVTAAYKMRCRTYQDINKRDLFGRTFRV